MTDSLAMIDVLCDSQNCFHDRPFEDLALPDKELLARQVINETEKRFRENLGMIDCVHATADCVYNRLNALVKGFASAVVSRLGNTCCSDEQGMQFIISYALAGQRGKEGRFLKPARARQLLEQRPPVDLMSSLGVNTVGELMDIEDIYSIFSLIRTTESSSWTVGFIEAYKTLSANDFESRSIEVRLFNPHHYPFIKPRLLSKQTVWEDKMMGTIFGMPTPNDCPVLTLRVLTRVYHYSVELLHHSSSLARVAGRDEFGFRLATMLQGVYSDYNFFEPHALAEALYWRRTFAFLRDHLQSVPGFEFWSGGADAGGLLTSAAGAKTTISCNLFDVISNVSKARPFPGNTRMFAMALKEKLFALACGGTAKADEMLMQNMDRGYINPVQRM